MCLFPKTQYENEVDALGFMSGHDARGTGREAKGMLKRSRPIKLSKHLWLACLMLGACQLPTDPQSLISEKPSVFDAPVAYFTVFGSKAGALQIHCFSVQHIVDVKYDRLEFFRHDRLMSGAHMLVARHAGGKVYTFVVEPDRQFQCVGSGFDSQPSQGVH